MQETPADIIMHVSSLIWRDGQPYSSRYQDIYFATDALNPQQGLAETRYVFLQHNQLAERWRDLNTDSFTIAETGFGTGLNFLCACQLWLSIAPECLADRIPARLHFISTEKYPISLADMQRAHALWPDLAAESSALLAQYQNLPAGFHRLHLFDGSIVLTLLIGDALDTLPQLSAKVDAWFLDGFAPAKNPDMWQASLFAQMARLSNNGATFATFTSAGQVKRGLAAAGFMVTKTKGYGRKREMLFGTYVNTQTAPVNTASRPAKTAIIIGAGIAGCATAHALAKRGWQVTVIERLVNIAQAASGNPQGVLYPRLAQQDSPQDRLSLTSYLYTLRLLQQLALGSGDFQPCGVLQMAFNGRESARILAIAQRNLAKDIACLVNAEQASHLAGVTIAHQALYFAQAGWVKPPAFCRALLQHANIQCITHTEALSLQQHDASWQVLAKTGMLDAASTVIIANANDALQFSQSAHLAITPVRGQMTTVNATPASLALKAVLCTDGYMTPALAGQHSLGATFSAQSRDMTACNADNQTNLAMLPAMSADLTDLALQPTSGRVALRCATPDYLPMLGELLDAVAVTNHPPKHRTPLSQLARHRGLYVNVGHGAKGLITAPLCAEILASLMSGEPVPADADLIAALQPHRFLLRDLGLKRLVTQAL